MLQNLIARVRADNNLKNMLKHSGMMYVSGLFSALFIIIQEITTARTIGPEAYGRFATIFGVSALIFLIVDVRTWELGTKLLARPLLDKDHEEAIRIITWLSVVDLITGVISAGVMLLFANLIAGQLLRSNDLYWVVSLYALSLPFRMFANGISRTLLRMYDRFGWLSVKSIIYGLARLIFIAGAALLNWGLPGVVLGAVLAEITGALVLLVMEWRIIRLEMPGTRPINFERPRQYREGLRMMRGLWLSATLWGLELEMYIPFLALLASPEQVGIFRSGVDIAETIEKLLVPFMLVLFPQIVKSYEQDTRPQFLRLTKQSGWLMALLTIPFTLGIMLLGPLLLPRLLGERFVGVAGVAALIAIGYTAYGIFMWTRPALVALSRIRELNLIGIAMMVIAALTLIVSLPTFGAVGAAAVRGGSMILQYGVSFIVFRRIIVKQALPSEMQAAQAETGLTGLAQDHAR